MPERQFICRACRAPAVRPYQARSHLCLRCSAVQFEDCQRAGRAVKSAIQRGELPPVSGQSCADCAKPARDYDHRDYLKPLAVEPVCRLCNMRRGPAYSTVYRPTAESA